MTTRFNALAALGSTMMQRPRAWCGRLLVGLSVLALAACGSSVPLNEVPVVDRTGAPVASAPQGPGSQSGATAGAGARAVAPVVVAPASANQPPASVARLVFFDYDSFIIASEYTPVLEAHARFLNADRTRKIALEGHTDERGGREYNLSLGQKRAEAVRRALSLLGVSEAQMEAVSLGEEKPAQAGATEQAYAANRRVEINYR